MRASAHTRWARSPLRFMQPGIPRGEHGGAVPQARATLETPSAAKRSLLDPVAWLPLSSRPTPPRLATAATRTHQPDWRAHAFDGRRRRAVSPGRAERAAPAGAHPGWAKLVLGAPSLDSGTSAMGDHVAVPVHWSSPRATHVPALHVGTELSDQDAYIVDVIPAGLA